MLRNMRLDLIVYPITRHCDGIEDCENGSDETRCNEDRSNKNKNNNNKPATTTTVAVSTTKTVSSGCCYKFKLAHSQFTMSGKMLAGKPVYVEDKGASLYYSTIYQRWLYAQSTAPSPWAYGHSLVQKTDCPLNIKWTTCGYDHPVYPVCLQEVQGTTQPA